MDQIDLMADEGPSDQLYYYLLPENSFDVPSRGAMNNGTKVFVFYLVPNIFPS